MPFTIAVAQYPITPFRRFGDWQAHAARWVADAAGAQLLLFPEYGAMELTSVLGGAVQVDLRAQIHGIQPLLADFRETYRSLSGRYALTIVAPGIPVVEGEKVFNRVHVFDRGRALGKQDKWFMTRFERERWGIHAAAAELTLFETEYCRFGVQICYDAEFPIGSAVLCAEGAQLILAPSCTDCEHGSARVHAGCRARALENQCFVAVSPTVGDAPWSPAVDVNVGYAAVYGPPDRGFPDDGVLNRSVRQTPGWLYQTLDTGLLNSVRAQGQVLNWKDHSRIGYALDGHPVRVIRAGA